MKIIHILLAINIAFIVNAQVECLDAPVCDDIICVVGRLEQIVLTATGEDIRFYSDATLTNLVHSGSPWKVPIVDDGNFYINPTNEQTILLYVTQSNLNCGESKADTLKIEIITCPVPRPTVNTEVICEYEATPVLSAVEGTNWSADAPKVGPVDFRWFTSHTNDPKHSSIVNIGDTYLPPSFSHIAVNTWYVAQYDHYYNCMGPSAIATITVNSSPDITLSNPTSPCQGDWLPIITASGELGTVYWYDQVPTKPPVLSHIATGSIYPIASEYNIAGTYTFYALNFKNGCWSDPASTYFEVQPLPATPLVQRRVSCSFDPVQQLSIMENNAYVIEWYDANGDDIFYQAAFVPDPEILLKDDVTNFTVRVRDYTACWSLLGSAEYMYIENPPVPEIISATYDDELKTATIEVDGSNIKWYDASEKLIGEGGNTIEYYNFQDGDSLFVTSTKTLFNTSCTSKKLILKINDGELIIDKPLSLNYVDQDFELIVNSNGCNLLLKTDKTVNLCTIEIYDLLGIRRFNKVIQSDETIDTSFLPKGIYIVVIKSKEKMWKKVVSIGG